LFCAFKSGLFVSESITFLSEFILIKFCEYYIIIVYYKVILFLILKGEFIVKIGLLPLYIELYDIIGSPYRPRLEPFYDNVASLFEQRGISVEKSEFCRLKDEFDNAIKSFEEAGVDAIVTLHMAYSPSLESIDALTATSLPVIVLDTTETLEFGQMQNPKEIGFNHGIHGVMDMCSMLKRNKKPYAIAAGHYQESDVIDRVCGFVKAAVAAKALCNAKAARVGGGFAGMGDFLVPNEELKERFGIEVDEISPEEISDIRNVVTDSEIDAEIADNEAKYEIPDGVIADDYREYIKSCVAMHKCLENGAYTAFTVNFRNVAGIELMPFIEACKAMERGIGYAGEGDVLTASFAGALLKAHPETSFVEIFCPDWKNNTVFMSHMGEMNYRIAENKPKIRRTGSAFVKGEMPYAGYARMKGGKGVYVNISRDKDDYKMVIAPGEMLSEQEDNFPNTIRGWMQPDKSNSTAEFLEKLSKNGATHHSSFVYGATVKEMEYFAQLLSLKTVVI